MIVVNDAKKNGLPQHGNPFFFIDDGRFSGDDTESPLPEWEIPGTWCCGGVPNVSDPV
jgi:hypothetical protein